MWIGVRLRETREHGRRQVVPRLAGRPDDMRDSSRLARLRDWYGRLQHTSAPIARDDGSDRKTVDEADGNALDDARRDAVRVFGHGSRSAEDERILSRSD